MEEILYEMYIQSLRAKLELCRIAAASLMESLQSPKLAVDECRAGFRQWVEMTDNGAILAFTLELIRRHEREAKEGRFIFGK